MPAPHQPQPLPASFQGVYTFMFEGVCLKAGRAGPNSGARWTSHHYKAGRAPSTLAWSLIRYAHLAAVHEPRLSSDLKLILQGIATDDIGAWIQGHTDRCNFLLDASLGQRRLIQLEAIAHEVLKPVFEGRWKYGGPTV